VSAGPGTDFFLDNILKPMLGDIQTNALSLLQQTLNALLGIGKRDNLAGLVSSLADQFNNQVKPIMQAAMDKIKEILGNFATLVGPQRVVARMNYLTVIADAQTALKDKATEIVTLITGLMGQVSGSPIVATITAMFDKYITMVMDKFESVCQKLLNFSQ